MCVFVIIQNAVVFIITHAVTERQESFGLLEDIFFHEQHFFFFLRFTLYRVSFSR